MDLLGKTTVIFLLIHGVSSLVWTSSSSLPDNVTLEACVGQNVTLDWGFQTHPDEHVQTVEWYFSPIGQAQDENFIGIALNGDLRPSQDVTTQLTFLPNAGLGLGNVKVTDSGTYSARVTVTIHGQRVTHVQRATVTVKDASSSPVTSDGQLHAELLSQPANGSQDTTHLMLACGQFDPYWGSKLNVVWTTPDNKTVPSTSFDNGRFLLSVSNSVADGDYTCHIDGNSPAAVCLANSSNANILQAVGAVHVNALEARLALMQAQLQALMAHQGGDVQLLETEVHQLQAQNQLLQQNLHELTMMMDDLRNQNTDLQNQLQQSSTSVAFHARKTDSMPTYAVGDVVDFEQVLTNQGGAYDNGTGVFVAPVNGTYDFHVTVVLDHNSPQRANRHVKIMADDQELCTATTSFKDHFEMGSCHAVVQLTAGQRVFVTSDNDGAQFIGTDNTFSGALLHAQTAQAAQPVLVG